jgi:hypothetical protein
MRKQSEFALWATIATLWFSFGLGTILNRFALTRVDGDITFPNSGLDRIWLVLGIWLSGYVAGAAVGFVGYYENRRSLIWSSVLGFELMILLRIIFLDAFPNVPHNAFNDLFGALALEQVPGSFSFLLLTALAGPAQVALAVVAGQTLARANDYRGREIEIDPRLIIASVLLPVSILVTAWGAVNILDRESLDALQQNNFEPIVFLHPDIFLNPLVHALIVSLASILIGLSPYSRGLFNLIVNSLLGGMIYVMGFVVTKDLLTIYAPADFEDPLDFAYPDIIPFVILWTLIVVTITAWTVIVYALRTSLLAPKEAQA